LGDKLKAEQIDVMEARGLLQQQHEDGRVSDSALREIVPSHKRKEKKKKGGK
jgi:hypothetical protein